MSGTGAEGRAGQEAARFLAAAQDWLRTSAPHLAPVDEAGEPCSCPLCRAVAGLREADPDAVARWVDTAVVRVSTALAQAGAAASDLARASGATATPGPGSDPTADASAGADQDLGADLDADPDPDPDTAHAAEDAADRPGGADADGAAVGHDGPSAGPTRRVRRIPLDDGPGTDSERDQP